MTPLPEACMAPIMLAWTAWLVVLALRRGRTAAALWSAAVIFGANAASIAIEAAGPADAPPDSVAAGKWAAVTVTAALLVVTLHATWRPQSRASRDLTPPSEADVEALIKAEVTRRVAVDRRTWWNRGRAEALAPVCRAIADEMSEEAPPGEVARAAGG